MAVAISRVTPAVVQRLQVPVQVLLYAGLFIFSQYLVSWLHLPLPANLVGMVLMLALIVCRIIPLSWVRAGARWLLAEMLLFFVPAVVAVVNYAHLLLVDGWRIFSVLHTIGSHGPTYYNRYPPQFKKFTPTCDTNEIQNCSQQQLINTYDNTVLYVDYIVDKAINLLKSHQDKFTTSLVYLSDHGESLGENGVYLHGLPYSIAPDTQKHVPMLIWLSKDYQQRYQVDQACLQKRASTLDYSQDNLFSTMLGLTGVQTTYYQANTITPSPFKWSI